MTFDLSLTAPASSAAAPATDRKTSKNTWKLPQSSKVEEGAGYEENILSQCLAAQPLVLECPTAERKHGRETALVNRSKRREKCSELWRLAALRHLLVGCKFSEF
jgi:hypothetical protein